MEDKHFKFYQLLKRTVDVVALCRVSVLTTAPPLLAINHITVSISLNAASHIGGIT